MDSSRGHMAFSATTSDWTCWCSESHETCACVQLVLFELTGHGNQNVPHGLKGFVTASRIFTMSLGFEGQPLSIQAQFEFEKSVQLWFQLNSLKEVNTIVEHFLLGALSSHSRPCLRRWLCYGQENNHVHFTIGANDLIDHHRVYLQHLVMFLICLLYDKLEFSW